SLVTLMEPGTRVDRPARIAPERHLYLGVSDIVAPEPGRVLPEPAHLQDLLGFVHAWDRAEPMLIHCFAGVSRSTADAALERNGRMNEAIAEIGRGEECFEGTPFVLELG